MPVVFPSLSQSPIMPAHRARTVAQVKADHEGPKQSQPQSNDKNHISPKNADMSFSFRLGGGALTVSLTDSVSGEIFRKIVYDKPLAQDYNFEKHIGYLLDVKT